MTPLEAAVALAAAHQLPTETPVVLKDGSNLLVHLAPAPVVIRVATLTARIRGDPMPWLEREVALVTALVAAGAHVMPPSDLLPPGPHRIDGWAMTAWRFVDHQRGVVPTAAATFVALDELHEAMRDVTIELPLLGPAEEDLDRAIAFARSEGLLDTEASEALRARRDDVVATLLDLVPDRQPLHGDSFPRNSLVTDRGIVWIDFEDCCSGPALWDLGTLLRSAPDPVVEATIRARYGPDALVAAVALRQVQVDVWAMIHDARRELAW